jgi:hypothetical protein
MKKDFEDQISDLKENLENEDNFIETLVESDRNDVERKFRIRGKKHHSVIGRNNSGIESLEFAIGGDLHNQIGICNDCIARLFEDLNSENLESVSEDIKTFLDSPKSSGGAGCSPGQHHGGQYNGEIFLSLFPSLWA